MASRITSIYIKPAYTTQNSRYTSYLQEKERGLLWSVADPGQTEDGPKGSFRCVTIQVTKTTSGWEPFDLEISGDCAEVAAWYKPPESGPPAKFVVLAKLDDRGWLLASNEQTVESPSKISFGAIRMSFRQPIYNLPFRIAGDITWAVQRIDIPNIPPVILSTKTRLELCFVFNTLPPAGPWQVSDGSATTNPDFGGVYYIDLFRLFLPDQWELIDAFGTGEPLARQLLWYLRRCVRVIWEMGLKPPTEYPQRLRVQLNPSPSQSFYLSPIQGVSLQVFQPHYGGKFNLRRWMSGFYSYCSPFDLAALTQLACAIVRDKDGKELLDSTWVASTGNQSLGQTSWGISNPGTFYGWPTFPSCTSPVFASDAGPSQNTKEDQYRAVAVDWHAWIEVKLPDSETPTVVDVTQAFGETNSLQFVSGINTRNQYLDLKMHQNWPDPGRLPPRRPALRNSEAVIFHPQEQDRSPWDFYVGMNVRGRKRLAGCTVLAWTQLVMATVISFNICS